MATTKGIGFTEEQGWQVLNGPDLINNRLERLFFQKQGGMLGHPDFGSLVLDFLNDPDDSVSHFDIMHEMQLLISQNEPYLILLEANISSNNVKDIGTVVTIKLAIEYTVTDEIFNVEFFRVRDIA